MQPEYIFETSWEVCNRVGGIYAVLSTRAASMQAEHKDKVIFFGPDFGDHSNLTFKESKSLLKGWRPKVVSLASAWKTYCCTPQVGRTMGTKRRHLCPRMGEIRRAEPCCLW